MFDEPFRGSTSGLSAGVLRGARFRRLFTDIYVRADVEVDLKLRALAAALLVQGRGVVAGRAAAELLDASCGASDAPVDVIVPGGSMRSRPGLDVRADLLATDEVTAVAAVPVTTPLLTTLHLACRPPVVEAIVAVDALAHVYGFAPEAVFWMGRRHLGARGSDSLDMAYPGIKLAIEYDGCEHRTQRRAMHDLRREAYLTAAGWEILRFTDAEVLGKPRWVAGTVQWALLKAAHARGLLLECFDPR